MKRKRSIPALWRRRFGLIPGYDPEATALPSDWFDVEAAELVCDFFPGCLVHVKGDKAKQPFELEEWQKALVGCLYGWKDRRGYRRYREVFVYVAKKNGKTALVAGLVLYSLWVDDEFGAEVYSAASSRGQASLIFSHAAGMVQLNPKMAASLTVFGARGGSVERSIVYEDALSSYKCLSSDADTSDGFNPHFSAIDELHRHKKPELAELLETSTGSRTQPITIYTTTADYNRESVCNRKLKYARDVMANHGNRRKPGYDRAFLPVVYECTKEDDWEDPATWRKANPNLGVTIPQDFLRRQCQKAKDVPTELNNFLRLHLNIVTDAEEAFFDIKQWDACDGTVETASLKGRPCYAGVDLASTQDLSALVLYFPEDNHAVLAWFWLPEPAAIDQEKRAGIPYKAWSTAGLVEVTRAKTTDYALIRRQINEIGREFDVKEVAFDPWNSKQLQGQLAEDGFDVVAFGQGVNCMTDPMKELERLVVEGDLRHGGNECLRWQAGNTMAYRDANNNVKPNKKTSTAKIDGVVSLIMAIGRAMVAGDEGASVYEDRGALMI